MHELSLAIDLLAMVEEAVRRERCARVASVRLEAGELSGVLVPALRLALQSLAPGSCLQGAQIQIDQTPGLAWCATCQSEVRHPRRGEACPVCGGYGLRPSAGTALQLTELLVHDEAMNPAPQTGQGPR